MKCINIFIQTRHIRLTVHSEAKINPNLPLSYQRQDIFEPSIRRYGSFYGYYLHQLFDIWLFRSNEGWAVNFRFDWLSILYAGTKRFVDDLMRMIIWDVDA